jgi:hypothetical protein
MRGTRLECPRCTKRLQPGFLMEKGNSDQVSVTQWVEGAPETVVWLGFKVGLNVKKRQVLPVTTFRCERCGYLESYAGAAGQP